MATQLVQYMDLRLTIDNNPPAYELPAELGHAPPAAALKYRHQQETETPSEVARIVDLESDTGSQLVSRQSSKQESRPSTKDTRASSKSLAGSKQGGRGGKSPTRLLKGESKPGSTASGSKSDIEDVMDEYFSDFESIDGGDTKEFAEIAIQDEGGDPSAAVVDEKVRTPATRNSRRSKSTLAPVLESDYDNSFDLFDESSWASVPGDQLSGRFAQYRRMSTNRLQQLEEQLELTNAKTRRKVTTLKAQFQEHKSKWEAERKILIEQVDQTIQLQGAAEKEADAAMTQLEDFISEQERLEQEEEAKRNEVLQASASLTPQEVMTPAQGSEVATPIPGTPLVAAAAVITPDSEQELQRLMQQTDDAKVQEMNARLGTCVSAPPAVDMERSALLRAESLSSMEAMKIEGATDEEIRASSAQSRASLRNTYKAKLEEAKTAAEDRRSKSPAINLPTKMTIDDELILDDEDDEEEEEEGLPVADEVKEGMLPFKDPSMYEIGTSPPPEKVGGFSRDPTGPPRDPSQPVIQKVIRKGTTLAEHPLLKEYLKAYDGVVSFKDGVGKIFLDKDMMSAHQMTSDLETLTFDQNKKAMPQVEELTKNIYHVLEEISSLINSILIYDREPPVSSINLMSREPTQKSFLASDINPEGAVAPPATRAQADSVASSHRSGRESVSSDKMHIKELQEQYNDLKVKLEEDNKSHQEQQQRNTVVMMEMQDTINELQRELSTLGKSAKRTKSATSSGRGTAVLHKSPSPETSVMFTRLDSERNAKIMKKAVMEEKLDSEKYKEAVAKMDEYVSLPAQRLAHLVKKYVHHTRMKEIEDKVKGSSSLNEEVFEVLDKMETLQNQRARQWAETMDEMGLERLKLANLLMDTLDSIEQESGIFLIKPMYSYRGRQMKTGQGKLSRPVRQVRHDDRNNAMSSIDAVSFIPAPTPASNYRLVRHQQHQLSTMAELKPVDNYPASGDGSVQVMGNGMVFSAGSPRTTWNMQASQPWKGPEDPSSYNTPRILELDINRMLIGQNNISTRVPFPPTDDRLVNANQNTLRSYVTVNRPTASFGGEKPEPRLTSGQESPANKGASTRSSAKKVRVSETDKDIPSSLPSPSPLPPITPTPKSEEDEEEEREGFNSDYQSADEDEQGQEGQNTDNEEEEEEDDEGKGDDRGVVDGVRPPSVAFSEEEAKSGEQ